MFSVRQRKFKNRPKRNYSISWWGIFLRRQSLTIKTKIRFRVQDLLGTVGLEEEASNRVKFFAASTMAASSRFKRFLIARAKRASAECRRQKTFWVRVGKKIFFYKKGHNQRMGKGVGSFATSRRVFRGGEVVCAFSCVSQKVVKVFKSYIKARTASLAFCVGSSYSDHTTYYTRHKLVESILRRRPSWRMPRRIAVRINTPAARQVRRARYYRKRWGKPAPFRLAVFYAMINKKGSNVASQRSRKSISKLAIVGSVTRLFVRELNTPITFMRRSAARPFFKYVIKPTTPQKPPHFRLSKALK